MANQQKELLLRLAHGSLEQAQKEIVCYTGNMPTELFPEDGSMLVLLLLLFAELSLSALEVRADLAPDPNLSMSHPSVMIPVAGVLLSLSAVTFGLWIIRKWKSNNASKS
jgi:hypothetical protein